MADPAVRRPLRAALAVGPLAAATSEQALARFAAGLTPASLPPAVIQKLKSLILDSFGVSLAGAGAPGIDAVLRAVTAWGGVPQSSVYVYGMKLPAPLAALANGVMATACDFDDTLDDAMLHTQPSVLPAALALAEARRCPGGELLAAVAAGTEMLCRTGRARLRGQEFLPTGSLGCMAAAAAAGRVLGLDERGILNACGIAYSQCGGNVQPLREGATVKRAHAGFASKIGVTSAVLAAHGLTGAHRWLEGEFGYFHLYERGDYRPDVLIEGLGERFHLLDLSLKPYPSARDNHGAVEAALDLAHAHDLRPDGIAAIDVWLPPNAYGVSGRPFPSLGGHPVVEAIASAAYCVAVAFCRRRLVLEDLTEDAVSDPAVRALAKRVRVHRAPSIADAVTFVPQRVVVRLIDGRTYDRTVSTLKGHPARPLADAARLEKFHACCAFCPRRVDAVHARAIVEAVANLESLPDVGKLGRLLTLANKGGHRHVQRVPPAV
jgi:2-methylcitrate dehydratase PrpD